MKLDEAELAEAVRRARHIADKGETTDDDDADILAAALLALAEERARLVGIRDAVDKLGRDLCAPAYAEGCPSLQIIANVLQDRKRDLTWARDRENALTIERNVLKVERERLRAVAEHVANRGCTYDDDCTPAALRHHYLCDGCRAQRALATAKPDAGRDEG